MRRSFAIAVAILALTAGPMTLTTLASVATTSAVSTLSAPGCSDQTVVTTETRVSDGGATTETITRSLTVTYCVSTLTLTPTAAAPLASVALTLSDVQPQLCTTEVHVVAHVIATPRFDQDGNLVGYDYSTTTNTFTIISCVSNTAIVRFDGITVASATPGATGLGATFAVPNVSPGTYTVTATPVAGTAASASFTVLDAIPPFITGIAVPAPNAAGWNGGDVVVEFACIDADSDIDSCTAPVTLSSEGAGQSVTGTALDTAGNSATTTVSGINIDKTGPTIVPHASRAPDHGAWYTAPVTIEFECADALSGIASCTAPVTLSDDGRAVVYASEAFDKAGNGLSFFGTVNIDTTPPTITAPPNIVTATGASTCASSPAIGTPVAADNLGSVAVTNDAPTSFPKGTTTVTWTASDPAGHTASASQTVTVNDSVRPTVAAPLAVTATATSSAGAVITSAMLGTATATDNCPGVSQATVTGLPAGNLFPIGTTVLTWTATDASGNVGTTTQTVNVAYGLCLLYDPTKATKLGSTYPIKLQLCLANGTNLSSAGLVPHVTGLVRTGSTTSTVAEDSGNANPDGDFRYDGALGAGGGYIFNLSTKGLTSGSWQIMFTVNGQTYSAPFQVK